MLQNMLAQVGLTLPGHAAQTSQLATFLTAAAKLKAVAEQAMRSPEGGTEALAESGSRKLAFHEPRPCPVCQRMYRSLSHTEH